MCRKLNGRCGSHLPLVLLLLLGLACLPSATALPPRPISITKRSTPTVAAGVVTLRAAAVTAAPPRPITSSSVLNRAVTARPTGPPSAPVAKPTIAPHAVQNKSSIQLIAVAAQVQAQRLSASAVVKTIQRVNHQAPCPPTTREVCCFAILGVVGALSIYLSIYIYICISISFSLSLIFLLLMISNLCLQVILHARILKC